RPCPDLLSLHGELDGVRARNDEGSLLGDSDAVVEDAAMVLPEETLLLPDVRVAGGGRADADVHRRLVGEVPGDAVDSGLGRALDRSDLLSGGIENRDLDRTRLRGRLLGLALFPGRLFRGLDLLFQPVVDRRAVGGVLLMRF